MSKVKPYLPHFLRDPGNNSFSYYECFDVDRCGNHYRLRVVTYVNKKGQGCEEIVQVTHLGKPTGVIHE